MPDPRLLLWRLVDRADRRHSSPARRKSPVRPQRLAKELRQTNLPGPHPTCNPAKTRQGLHVMDEIFPLLGGVVLGLAASMFQPKWRWVIVGLVTVLLAFTASRISGELAADWRFVLLDAVEVLLGALAAMGVIAWRRHARSVS
jgi:hypothetical protein